MASEVLPLLLETGESVGPAEGYPTLTAASFSHFFAPLLQVRTGLRRVTNHSSIDWLVPYPLSRTSRKRRAFLRRAAEGLLVCHGACRRP